MTAHVSPVLTSFNVDLDRSFGAEFNEANLYRQRRIYDEVWHRYDAPRPANVKVRDYSIMTRDGVEIAARLYWRISIPSPMPLCLYFHGGGWAFGSIESHDLITSRLAENSGVAVLSIAYRLAPEYKHPTQIQDCWDALQWVHRNAGRLGFDSELIGVAGDSAGAALAAGLAMMARDQGNVRIHHQGLIYPCLQAERPTIEGEHSPGIDASSIELYLRMHLRASDDVRDPYAMPLSASDLSGLPSALIMIASEDACRADGEVYAERLAAKGILVELTTAEGMPHTFLRIIHMDAVAGRAFKDFCARLASAYGQSVESPWPKIAIVT